MQICHRRGYQDDIQATKKIVFLCREKKRHRAIKNGCNTHKWHKVAKKLRAAKMHLIKTRRQSVETDCDEDKLSFDRLERWQAEAGKWKAAST